MSGTTRQPWDRRPGEGRKPYEGFRAYLALGDDRSLVKVAHDLGKTPQLMSKWSLEHEWVARCEAHDAHLGAIEMGVREKVRAKMAEVWEKRRQDALEDDWAKSQVLAGKIKTMIDMMLDPSKPLAPTASNIGKMLKLMEMLRRLRGNVFGEAKAAEVDDFDPTTATPDELRAYLASKGVKTEGG